MGWLEEIKCPYCGYKNLIDNYYFEDGDNEIDVECENEDCMGEFKVVREWTPSFSTYEINYYKCKECGKEDRDDNIFEINDNEYLCRTCYFKREIEKLNKV